MLSIINQKFIISQDVNTSASHLSIQDGIELFLVNEKPGTSREACISNFFISGFVWADILSRALLVSLNSRSPEFDYTPLLKSGTLDLDKVMGCQNWAMLFILEIAALERYKYNTQRVGTLNYSALLELGIQIKNRLLEGLENLLAQRHSLRGLAVASSLVTEMFARGSLIYLAFVLSGSHAQTLELQQHVADGMRTLQVLPLHLVIRVAWPICMIGCMASLSEEDQIRNFIMGAVEVGTPMGTVWKALRIMQECWNLRRNSGHFGNCDWRAAMASLGLKILLI